MEFFATSHGKSVCDGIGGTVNCLTANASLQRPASDQILNVHDKLTFCKGAMEDKVLFNYEGTNGCTPERINK